MDDAFPLAAELARRVQSTGIVRNGAGRYDVGMMFQSSYSWVLFALVGAMYVLMCVRVAGRMARIGRSGAAWFFISFFFTAIPAARVLRRYSRQARAVNAAGTPGRAAGRCRHCGAVLGDRAAPDRPAVCPRCGMKLGQEELA